jgi:transposase-like protein
VTGKRYTDEFKIEAVRQVTEHGRGVARSQRSPTVTAPVTRSAGRRHTESIVQAIFGNSSL